MAHKKLRVAFTRLLLAAPALPLLGCGGGDPIFMNAYTVPSQSLPDGSVWPGPDATCDDICKRVAHCYYDKICELKERRLDGTVVVSCSNGCDGRRPEGLVSHGRVEGSVSVLGALFALKAHLEAASVPAFERLARELETHGAPAELVRAALRSAREEVGHARAMEALARRNGAPIPEVVVEYEVVRDNLATLLAEASEVGRGLPRYVERDFARYLECGVLAHGFARVRCESCKDELLVAFSCKGRGVCPSCNAKRAHVTAVHLVERVLPHVPYRQWTLSFPHRVRWALLKDTSFSCVGAGWRLGTAGRRGTLRRAAATQPDGGGAAAGGAAPPGATHAGEARCAARGRARGRAAGLSGPVPSAALPMDGAGRAATAQSSGAQGAEASDGCWHT